ncbi:unnamed protein product, partial [Polarella glacialis]
PPLRRARTDSDSWSKGHSGSAKVNFDPLSESSSEEERRAASVGPAPFTPERPMRQTASESAASSRRQAWEEAGGASRGMTFGRPWANIASPARFSPSTVRPPDSPDQADHVPKAQRSKSTSAHAEGATSGLRSAGMTTGSPRTPRTSKTPPRSRPRAQTMGNFVESLAPEESPRSSAVPDGPCSAADFVLALRHLQGTTTAEQRRKIFKVLLLRWHPDKNVGNEDHATEMFRALQESKGWFLFD